MAFESGKSGNPGGRPKRDKFITQQLIAELREIDPETQASRLRKVIRGIVTKAEDGDVAAFNAICDRVEGKVPQVIAGDEDSPVRIERIVRVIVDPAADRPGTQNGSGLLTAH